MKLKQFIESHPLPTLVAVVVASASTTAASVSFVANSHFDAEKLRIEAEYKSDLSMTKAKLASIERKVGSDEATFFDVSKLVITSEQIKSLDQIYKTGADGLFFYIPPIGGAWAYSLLSEYDLVMLKTDLFSKNDSTKLLSALGNKNVHLWRANNDFVFSVRQRDSDKSSSTTFRFFPMVSVQVLDESQFKRSVAGMTEFLESDTALEKVSEQLEVLLNNAKSQSLPDADANSLGKTTESRPAVKGRAKPVGLTPADMIAGEKKIELENYLGKLFRGDLAAVTLAGLIQQTLQAQNSFEGVEVSLDSIQKKGNVLYIRMSLKFIDANVKGLDKPRTVIVDREIFVVTNSKKMYVVQVEVPTLDGRSDAYGWVGQWLSSVRIPI